LDHESEDARKVETSSPQALSDVIASEEDDLDIQLENEVLLEDEACFGDDLEVSLHFLTYRTIILLTLTPCDI
jgi:hypothetical protein